MNLIIDVGNTKVKMAIFSRKRLLKKTSIPYNDIQDTLDALLIQYPGLRKAILASVGKSFSPAYQKLKGRVKLVKLDLETALPFKNKYKTPRTLGVDRIALIAAAAIKYPKVNTLVIDAGTCITYDFINRENEYLGGAISPGIRLRYKSLNNLTANLPLLETRTPRHYIGASTNASIHSGVINGVINEMEGVIDQYRSDWSDLTVILTGGDAKLLSKRLKNSIFANPNFLLEGLNYILEFNT
ncbi:MAG: type III pantothenate kinase [Flavobacteriaceae bacterium]|nr:type III pantothenate kinase [Flavobacteriaceae bacterium]